MHLKVCVSAHCLMSFNFNNLYERGRQKYLHICEPTWAPKLYVLSILKVGGKERDQFFFPGGRQDGRGLPLEVHFWTSAGRMNSLFWTVWEGYIKQHHDHATMESSNIAMGKKPFYSFHPCIRIDRFIALISRGPLHRHVIRSLRILYSGNRFTAIVDFPVHL